MPRVEYLVTAIERECVCQAERPNKLLIEFMANIAVALATERRISAASLIYVEYLFSELGRRTTSSADFRAVMGAVINLREAMFDLAVKLESSPSLPDFTVRRLLFRFVDTFPIDVARALGAILGFLVHEPLVTAELVRFENGSTLMEFLLSMGAPSAAVGSMLTLAFTQADVVVSKTADIKSSIGRLLGVKRQPTTIEMPETVQAEKMPAILKTGSVLPELGPVRIAVERSGKTLIVLDGKVEITILP